MNVNLIKIRESVILALPIILLVGLISCKREIPEKKNSTEFFVLLYTNDEHGWMEPNLETDGAAGLVGLWKSHEGYDESDSYLILSGGDMWTGPAISTWFNGESMVEVMNAMEYDAAALGNHEFDFTVTELNKRVEEMNFPLLSANIREKTTGNIPSFVEPYTIIDAGDVQVGILGLSSLSTPYSTFPAYVEDYYFIPYADAIEEFVPEMISNGAELLIIIGHICENEMESLVQVAKSYGISIIGGGHCHQEVARVVDGVVLIEAGAQMKAYTRVEFTFNSKEEEFILNKLEIISNTGSQADESIENIVTYWKFHTDMALSEEIGYCSETIYKYSTAMGNLVTDSWFYTFPDADVTITNSGGIRQDIFQGSVSLESIVGLLPFNNTILELELTGTELLDCIGSYLLLGGMTTIG
ncbi:MAG: bifunctional UDP-sugar hydrolase/5'-nucleotidase, partial [Bacteroidota bacterium]|nr:bifunctional UDP-sugar hydrolase/5'-nucleotidase [Bacteroidota bacterium]